MRNQIKILLREGLISEIHLIQEKLEQAEKILKTNNIPLDDPTFLSIKSELEAINKVRFIGLIYKIGLKDKNFEEVKDFFIKNIQQLNNLPNPINTYDDLDILLDDFENMGKYKTLKKFTNKLTNKTVLGDIERLKERIIKSQDFIHNIDFLLNANSADRKEFMGKTDKYNTAQELFKSLGGFIKTLKEGFKFDIVKRKIDSLDPSSIKTLIVDKGRNMILARVIKYEASRSIGSESWCITADRYQFDEYTKNGDLLYFFFNFNGDIEPNLKMIGFTLNGDNDITNGHDRYDEIFMSAKKYLTSIGVSEKIYEINSRERKEKKLNDLGKPQNNYSSDIFVLRYNDYENEEKTYYNDYKMKLKNIGTYFMSELISPTLSNLDIIFNKFENYGSTANVNDKKMGGSKETEGEKVNIIIDALTHFDEVKKRYRIVKSQSFLDSNNLYSGVEHGRETSIGDYIMNMPNFDEKSIIESLTNAMKSPTISNKIQRDTKRAIYQFLKERGVDILTLSKGTKDKEGKGMSDMEFGMMSKRGDNLKPIIQNKLSALRRGENPDISFSEINYAIDNGYKDIIEKYYSNMINSFSENQLDYENAQIYKKLGLLNVVAEVIYKKGDQWGVEALNSIEKSIYDLYSNKLKNTNLKNKL